MKYFSLALLLVFTVFSFQSDAITLQEKCSVLKVQKHANPLFIETTLGSALSNLKKGEFSQAVDKVNDALVIFNAFDRLSHPYTTHMAGALFFMHVYNYEKLPDSVINRFKGFFQNALDSGVYFRPYEEVIGLTTLEIIELQKAGKYSEAIKKTVFAKGILEKVAVFNFVIEQEFINEVLKVLTVKHGDLLILSGKKAEGLKIYSSVDDNMKARLSDMVQEGKERFMRLAPGIIFDKGRRLDELYFSLAFTYVRINNLSEAEKLLQEGLRIIPSSAILNQLKENIK